MTGSPAAAPRTLTLRLPLPPQVLNPNVHGFAYLKRQVRRQYARECYMEALTARGGLGSPFRPFGAAQFDVRFEFCAGRRSLDSDNCVAAFKGGRDALISARIIENDSARLLQSGTVEVVRHKRACNCAGFVVLTITEREAA